MARYRSVELVEGVPVQFLGIYATRWPYESGVEPTIGFVEDYGDYVYEERIKKLEEQVQQSKWLMQFAVESWDARFDIDGYVSVHEQRLEQIRDWLKENNG